MNIRIILLTFLLSTLQLSFANNIINQATAEKVAKNAYFERSFQQNPVEFNSIKINELRIESLGEDAALYIINFDHGGFVIVSADDAMPPILGYDLEGYCPANGINQNFDSFLSSYVNQIGFIRENNIEPEADIAQQWEFYTNENPQSLAIKSGSRAISPLLINLWNQVPDYKGQRNI